MIKLPITLLATLLVFSLFSGCRDKCQCRDLEDCIDGICVLKPNSYYINNQGIGGTNLYHGVAYGNSCVDTLVLDLNLSEPNPSYRYLLYANVPTFGVYNVSPDLVQKISDTEFIIGSVSPICYKSNLVYWYASSIHCKQYTDSVQMLIKFRQSDDPPNAGYIDSCRLTLFK